MTHTDDVAWHIGTKSADAGGQCVEAGPINDGGGRVALRHSRKPGKASDHLHPRGVDRVPGRGTQPRV